MRAEGKTGAKSYPELIHYLKKVGNERIQKFYSFK
jgi:hypothetical protein